MPSKLPLSELIPESLKPPLRAGRRILRGVVASLGTPVRARTYRSEGGSWLHLLPASLRRRWRLDPPPPGSRRIEVGSGQRPLPGYIHVDVDPDSRSVDLLVRGPCLPVKDGWSDEILSVHMIEHVPPPMLRPTLREWFRVLRDGGSLRIHTPNGNVLGQLLVDSAMGSEPNPFWAVQCAIFGYGMGPAVTGPDWLTTRTDHRMILTFPVLRFLLEEVGFAHVEDISGEDPCLHALHWAPYIPGLCLEVRAVKTGTASLTPGPVAGITAS